MEMHYFINFFSYFAKGKNIYYNYLLLVSHMSQKTFILHFKPRNVKRVHNGLYCVVLSRPFSCSLLLFVIIRNICFVLSSLLYHLQVKADSGSKRLGVLQQASRHVNEMAAGVVASTKTGLDQIEDKGKWDVIGGFCVMVAHASL